MTDFLDIKKARYTVRDYGSRELERAKLHRIYEAGRWAPTAVNLQPQRIIVLDGEEGRARIREFTTFRYDPKYAALAAESADKEREVNSYHYNARIGLLVCYDSDICWKHPSSGKSSGETDATIVATHMMLEAASIGVGSSWISYFDEDKARRLLSIPTRIIPVVLLLLRYPSESSKPNTVVAGKRHPLDQTVFYGKLCDGVWER